MKEYYVRFLRPDGEDCLVVLPSFLKLLRWFLGNARRCNCILISVEQN